MAVRYQQPQTGPARLETSNPLVKGLLAAYPSITGNGLDAKGLANIIGVDSPLEYTTSVTPLGLGLRGGGTALAAAKGAFTAAGAIPYHGASEFSAFFVVVLRDLSSGLEAAVWRATSTGGSSGIVLEILPSTKTIRVALATNGVTGWTAGNDFVDNAITVDVPWVFGMSYKNGSGINVYSGPLKGALTKTAIPGVTGTIADSGGSSGPMYIGGMLYAATTIAFPGTIVTGDFYGRELAASEFNQLSSNPWQLFKAPSRVFRAAAGGAATLAASVTATDAADTTTSAAQASLTASLTATDKADSTSSSAQALAIVSLTAYDAPDTTSSTAQALATASLTATDASDTTTSAAQASLAASLTATDAADSTSGSASAAVVLLASLTATDAPDTTSSTAQALVAASLSGTDAADTTTSAAQASLAASLTATDKADSTSSSAQALAIVSLTAYDAPDTVTVTASASGVSASTSYIPSTIRFASPKRTVRFTSPSRSVRFTSPRRVAVIP